MFFPADEPPVCRETALVSGFGSRQAVVHQNGRHANVRSRYWFSSAARRLGCTPVLPGLATEVLISVQHDHVWRTARRE